MMLKFLCICRRGSESGLKYYYYYVTTSNSRFINDSVKQDTGITAITVCNAVLQISCSRKLLWMNWPSFQNARKKPLIFECYFEFRDEHMLDACQSDLSIKHALVEPKRLNPSSTNHTLRYFSPVCFATFCALVLGCIQISLWGQ